MRSSEVLVTEEAGAITVRPRLTAALAIFTIGAALGSGLILLSVALAGALPALGAFSLWGGALIAGLSVLVAAAGLAVRLTRRTTLDFTRGVIRKGRTIYDRSVITDIALKSSTLMDQEILTIVAMTRTGELVLVSGHMPRYRLAMSEAAARMRRLLGGSARVCDDAPGSPTSVRQGPSPALRRLPGLISTIMGALISVTGYFMIPDIVLTLPPAPFGILFWPVGIWIAVPGVLGLTGVMDRGFLRGKALHGILIAAWVASYLIVCFKRLS